jgi:excisionase family DNA binding protein
MNVLRAHDYIPEAFNDGFDLLTTAQVAAILHVSKAHVCHAIAGRLNGCPPLPAVRIGRRMLVRRSSLLAWIEQRESDNLISSPERGRRKSA